MSSFWLWVNWLGLSEVKEGTENDVGTLRSSPERRRRSARPKSNGSASCFQSSYPLGRNGFEVGDRPNCRQKAPQTFLPGGSCSPPAHSIIAILARTNEEITSPIALLMFLGKALCGIDALIPSDRTNPRLQLTMTSPDQTLYNVATRRSPLALAQARLVVDLFSANMANARFQLREMVTTGDRQAEWS